MPKAKIKQRKDNKGRVLQKGESQRKQDGMYIYTYVDPFGKRCYVYSADLFALRVKEQQLIRDQQDGINYYVGGSATINMTFDRYMSVKHSLRETTKSSYKYVFNKYVRDGFGNKKLTEVKYSDVKFFYQYLLDEKDLSIATVDHVHTILHPIFDMAVRDDIVRKNPTDGVMAEIKRNSGKNKGIRKALTVEQQNAFMDTIRSSPEYYHWYPLFATMLGTGMRVSELCGLCWDNVDFEKRCITVDHAVPYYVREGKSCFGLSKPKTEAGIRLIPMMDSVYEALKAEFERQKNEGFPAIELEGMTGFIFANRYGNLHAPHTINLAIKRISELHNSKEIIAAAKEKREPLIIPNFSCHILRHTFCSRLCENEVNVKVIQEIMGHANIETTLDIYTDINYNKKQKSLEELSKKINFF